MKGKILFVAGLAAGYVLGARAGRSSYEKIKNRADAVWHDPNVQKGVNRAEDFVAEKAPIVGKKLTETAADAAHAVSDKAKGVSLKSSGTASDAAAAVAGAADAVSDKAKAARSDSAGSTTP